MLFDVFIQSKDGADQQVYTLASPSLHAKSSSAQALSST